MVNEILVHIISKYNLLLFHFLEITDYTENAVLLMKKIVFLNIFVPIQYKSTSKIKKINQL